MKVQTLFTLFALTCIASQIFGCSNITGEETTTEEPLSYQITEGACGEVVFEESVGTDSTSAVETIRQQKIEWFGRANFIIKSTPLKVEDDQGNVPEEKFYALHILDEDGLHLHSVAEVITDKGNLYKLWWCPD